MHSKQRGSVCPYWQVCALCQASGRARSRRVNDFSQHKDRLTEIDMGERRKGMSDVKKGALIIIGIIVVLAAIIFMDNLQ